MPTEPGVQDLSTLQGMREECSEASLTWQSGWEDTTGKSELWEAGRECTVCGEVLDKWSVSRRLWAAESSHGQRRGRRQKGEARTWPGSAEGSVVMTCQWGADTWEAGKGNLSYAGQYDWGARKAEGACVPAYIWAWVPEIQTDNSV